MIAEPTSKSKRWQAIEGTIRSAHKEGNWVRSVLVSN